MIDFLKFTLIPGSLSFLVLTTTVGLALMSLSRPAWRRFGRLALISVLTAYWLCTVPALADALQGGTGPVAAAEQCLARQHCTLVVLGSGMQVFRSGGLTVSQPLPQTVLNALKGRELGRRTDGLVIVSGGAATQESNSEAALIAGILQQGGVDGSRIVLETQSHTTRDQAIEVARLAKQRGLDEIVLITSPAHLRRALAVFRAQGLNASGYPASLRSDGNRSRWIPSIGNWVIARDACYEGLAYLYYWTRGWL